VAHDDQLGALLLRDVDDRVGRVALARIGRCLDPRADPTSTAARRVASASSRGLTSHCSSAGASWASSRSRASGTGS